MSQSPAVLLGAPKAYPKTVGDCPLLQDSFRIGTKSVNSVKLVPSQWRESAFNRFRCAGRLHTGSFVVAADLNVKLVVHRHNS